MAHVLIIDDMTTDAEFAARPLRAAGHTVHTAADGEEGLRQARLLLPQLILLDVVMPRLDGFATCKQLKRDPSTAKIPVVLVTSKDGENDRFWGRRQGADEHLPKPYTAERLMALVAAFL